MTRSIWKPPYIDPSLLKQMKKRLKSERKSDIKTYSRRSKIVPQMVGLTFLVYNGKSFVAVKVNEEMIGHKLGEFSPTRVFKGHAGDKKGKKVAK